MKITKKSLLPLISSQVTITEQSLELNAIRLRVRIGAALLEGHYREHMAPIHHVPISGQNRCFMYVLLSIDNTTYRIISRRPHNVYKLVLRRLMTLQSQKASQELVPHFLILLDTVWAFGKQAYLSLLAGLEVDPVIGNIST